MWRIGPKSGGVTARCRTSVKLNGYGKANYREVIRVNREIRLRAPETRNRVAWSAASAASANYLVFAGEPNATPVMVGYR